MKSSSGFDDFINKQSDLDRGWWPLLRLRPAKDERVSLGRLSLMSLSYGVLYALVAMMLFRAFGRGAWGQLPELMAVFVIGFFVGWGAVFRPPWNRRAARLKTQHLRE